MMEVREIVFDVQRRYAVDWDAQAPIQQDIDLWTGGSEQAESALYNRIAEELALGYCDKRLVRILRRCRKPAMGFAD